jgi:hypothetical protein
MVDAVRNRVCPTLMTFSDDTVLSGAIGKLTPVISCSQYAKSSAAFLSDGLADSATTMV